MFKLSGALCVVLTCVAIASMNGMVVGILRWIKSLIRKCLVTFCVIVAIPQKYHFWLPKGTLVHIAMVLRAQKRYHLYLHYTFK